MRLFGNDYYYNCTIPLLYISIINLILLIASLLEAEFDMVKSSSRMQGLHVSGILSPMFNIVTAFISILTIIGAIYSSQKLILLLLIWDGYRFLFVIWLMTGAGTGNESVYYVFLVGWLALCLIAEMSYLTQPKTHPFTPISAITFDADYPPRYDEIAPPPYSEEEFVRSSSIEPDRPASTVFNITEEYSAGAAPSSGSPPPAYKTLDYKKNHTTMK